MYCKVVIAILVSSCALQAMAESPESAEIDDGILSIDVTNEAQVRAKFEEFKSKFGRNYDSKQEEEKRFSIFQSNLANIQELNKLRKNADDAIFGINNFTDQSEEDMKKRTGFVPPP